jgi:hypothetical protein
MLVLNGFFRAIISKTYIWHHKRKADITEVSCYSCTCLLQPSKKDGFNPARRMPGRVFFCLALVQTLRWIKFIKSIKISQLSKLSLPYPQNCPPKFAVMICVAVDAVLV